MRLDKSLDSHNPEAFDSHAPYSVLMSVYRKEDPSHLLEALDSMVSQTVPPEEIVLVEDGMTGLCFVKFLWAVSAFLLVRLSGCF